MGNVTYPGAPEAPRPAPGPAFPAARPMNLGAAVPRLFDAACGLVHYFVRPDDGFVLNTLELLDADAYLYRLLRSEGYRRAAFVEVDRTDCRIYVYDTPSERLFCRAGSEKKGPEGLMRRQPAPPAGPTPAPARQPAAGRRQAAKFYEADEFSKKFAVEINAALEDAAQPTAIVMPLAIFEKGGYFGDKIVDTVARIEKIGNRGNILLLTMPRRSDLLRCFGGEYPRLHPWVNAILARQQAAPLDLVREAVKELSSLGLLVLADEYQTDEIANLLLRKKHLLGVPGLADLPDGAVYPLAGQLREHCTQVKDHKFVRIPYLNRTRNCLRQLNNLLEQPEVQRELTERAQGLQTRNICTTYSAQLPPLLLERAYHLNLRRYEDGSAVDEILAEFDQYVGEEMRQVKEAVLRAARSFQRQKRQAARPEDAPRMNLVFSGPPGTGKTTIARLTARLFHAMELLPAGVTVETSAGDLSASHIGETKEKVLDAFRQADGGVLFIDEFHGFYNAHEHGNVANEAMQGIVAGINAHQGSLCLIVAGYEDGVERVLRCDEGARSRFSAPIRFQAYSTDTLLEILRALAARRGMGLDGEAEALLRQVIDSDRDVTGAEHGNGRNMENLLGKLDDVHTGGDRYTREDVLRAFPDRVRALPAGGDAAAILGEFDRYAGGQMRAARTEIEDAANYFESQMDYIRRRRAAGETPDPDEMPYLNLRFLGPPGTGKSTVAGLAARYFAARGLLHRDFVHRVQASTLLQGTVGGTGERLRAAAREANGGVLFLDEFQGLDSPFTGGNLAAEAMHALVGVANEFQNSLCIIIAGCEEDVERILQYGQGASQCFPHKIRFQNYDVPTLMAIFDALIQARGNTIEPDARDLLEWVVWGELDRTDRPFGNAGDIKKVLLPRLEMKRIARDREDRVYRREDILAAFPEAASAGA